MTLERVQVVKNFTRQLIISQALVATPATPYSVATAGQKTILDTIGRVGRRKLVIPANQAVTITDQNSGAYTVTNPAGAQTLVHVIEIINGHLNVLLSAANGTIAVVVLAD